MRAAFCLLLCVTTHPLVGQSERLRDVLAGLIHQLGRPQENEAANDRLQAIGAPALPFLLDVLNPARTPRSLEERVRRDRALLVLVGMGRRATGALPQLMSFLPKLARRDLSRYLVAIGEIGPFAKMTPDRLPRARLELHVPRAAEIASCRLDLGSSPSAADIEDVLASGSVSRIAAAQALRAGLRTLDAGLVGSEVPDDLP